ncbi:MULTISPECIES: 3-dehydroquinate synthase [Aequorivita]|uniref:3-dehydroquinate synthase n=1 Tax=Aequorivita iocasae TaxID=2803865 RepID=A0ABX7DPV5_9FLAO|nr:MULTISPECIES: 3-dehydroquinate synthase [Aequorivita]QQX76108.1 3-dehydroquinate synthase [Aequorivita iocasae]UCA55568.1 3-dehydroquinate synthase [Aequorivita sp. F7]
MENSLKEKGLVYYSSLGWKVLSNYLYEQKDSKIFILTDENTKRYCSEYFLEKLCIEFKLEVLTISAGEAFKNIFTCMNVWNTLSEKGADRNSIIINLGGGVVTDLGGFVASTFKRGLRFINIPTSLLAMVDASVGGKNGVDLGSIKNQIGVITLPEMVLIDTEFLKTLPKAHLTSGLAEMLKHGLIHSKKYWERIKGVNVLDEVEFEKLIRESVDIKKEIVTKDPLEKNLRKTLNYGHTLGHAIESYFLESDQKPELLHGEAVAIGIILATHISTESLGFPKKTLDDVTRTILSYFPRQNFSKSDIEAVIKFLVFDKKNRNGKVLFVLLEDIGQYKIDCEVSNSLIYSAFEYYKNF